METLSLYRWFLGACGLSFDGMLIQLLFFIIVESSMQVYLEDTFGLHSLDKRGSLHKYTFSGISHIHWHKVKEVFVEAIEPWLT